MAPDQPGPDQPGADQPGAEQPGAEQPSAGRLFLRDLAPEQLAAQRRLTETTREFNLAAATTALPPEVLAEVTETIAALTERLSMRTTPRVVRFAFDHPAKMALTGQPVHLNSLNPLHPAMDVELTGDFAAAARTGNLVGLAAASEIEVDSLNEGPPDSVHGGHLSFLMDCILGILVQSTGVPAVTGTLEVHYLHRTPLDRPIRLWSRIDGQEGRKLRVVGGVELDGEETVRASGIFIQVPPSVQGIGAQG